MAQPSPALSKRREIARLGILAEVALGAMVLLKPSAAGHLATLGGSIAAIVAVYITGESGRPSGAATSVLADLPAKRTQTQ